MFISQTHASALVFNHYVSYVYSVYIIYDLVINVKENRTETETDFKFGKDPESTTYSKSIYIYVLSILIW